MSGLLIRNFNSATGVYYLGGVPYDADGAILVTQDMTVSQRADGWVRTCDGATDTQWVVLVPVIMPARTMGPNSRLEVILDWEATGTGQKFFGLDFGGSNVSGPSLSAATGVKYRIEIFNKNSLTSQRTQNSSTFNGQAAYVTTSIDTSGAVTLDIKMRWNANTPAGTETATLLGYSVRHFPGT